MRPLGGGGVVRMGGGMGAPGRGLSEAPRGPPTL